MADGEITISELELSEELLADMVIPVETSTDTKSATLAQLRSWLGTSLPVGSIFASVGKIDDARFTLLDGKTLSTTGTYAEFYLKAVEKVQAGRWQSCTEEEFNQEVSQYGQCMKFVISNDYVRIPKAGNSLYSANLFGADLLVAGNGSGLGLTSNGSDIGTLGSSTSGSLARAYPYQGTPTLLPSTTSGTIIVSGDKQALGITTDPTKSGIIAKTDTLGNNTIVYYYMVISTEGQTEPVDIDINQVYEDMELKANKNLSNVDNVSQDFKNASVSWGMPDYTAGITISTSGFTATFDGLLVVQGYKGGGNQNASVVIDGLALGFNREFSYNNSSRRVAISLPICKGSVVTFANLSELTYGYYFPLKGVI